MKITKVIVAVLLTTSIILSASAQEQIVTVKFTDRPFREVLQDIGYHYGLNFSYGNDLPALDETISIDVKGMPLHEFLKELFKKVGAKYKVIDHHVAITEKVAVQSPKEPTEKTHISKDVTTKELSNLTDDHIIEEEILVESEPDRVTQYATEPQAERDQVVVVKDVSVKNDAVKNQTIESITQKGEQQKPSKEELKNAHSTPGFTKNTAFGFVGSLDFYAFYSDDYESSRKSYSVKPNYSVGIYVHKMISRRWSIEMQTRLGTRNFSMKYNYRLVDANDPLVVDKTHFELLYINVPVKVNYFLLEKNNLTLDFNTGFVIDFLIKDRLDTYRRNGDESEIPELLGKVQPFTAGVIAGIQGRYAIRQNVSINLSPTYRQYFTPFNDGSESIGVRMISLEVGFLFEL